MGTCLTRIVIYHYTDTKHLVDTEYTKEVSFGEGKRHIRSCADYKMKTERRPAASEKKGTYHNVCWKWLTGTSAIVVHHGDPHSWIKECRILLADIQKALLLPI